MPQRKNAVKALKQNRVHQMRNLDIKSALRKCIKAFNEAVATDLAEAKKLLPGLYKSLDKACKRNILPRNTASRRKARYAKLLNAPAKKA